MTTTGKGHTPATKRTCLQPSKAFTVGVMLPAHWVAQIIGYQVSWNAANKTVTVTPPIIQPTSTSVATIVAGMEAVDANLTAYTAYPTCIWSVGVVTTGVSNQQVITAQEWVKRPGLYEWKVLGAEKT